MNSTTGHAAEHVAHWMQRTREAPSSAWSRFSTSSRKEIFLAVDVTTIPPGSLGGAARLGGGNHGRGLLQQHVGVHGLLHQLVHRHESGVHRLAGEEKGD